METAVVLPVFLTLVFAVIQFGHVCMVESMLQEGCRQAARLGATENVTTDQTIDKAVSVIGGGVRTEAVEVIVKDANVYDSGTDDVPVTSEDFHNLPDIELSTAESRRMFIVRAEASYNDISPLSLPWMQNVRVVGHTVMRHE